MLLHMPKSPPKRLDPALWAEARREWEGTPNLTYSAIAVKLGVSVPSVTLRAQRELWVRGNIVDLERIDYSPMQMVEVSIRALMRAAGQTKDLPTAVKAAGMLLDRALGRVVQEAKPMLAPEEASSKDWPEFMDKERLSYRHAPADGQQDGQQDAQETRSALDPPPTPAQPEIASAAPPRPQLHAVAPTTWFDAPSRPAS